MTAFEIYKQTETGKKRVEEACASSWSYKNKEYPLALLEFFERQRQVGHNLNRNRKERVKMNIDDKIKYARHRLDGAVMFEHDFTEAEK